MIAARVLIYVEKIQLFLAAADINIRVLCVWCSL
jgi:hypothetical protein